MRINYSDSTTLRRLQKLDFRSYMPKTEPLLLSNKWLLELNCIKKGYAKITEKRYFSAKRS